MVAPPRRPRIRSVAVAAATGLLIAGGLAGCGSSAAPVRAVKHAAEPAVAPALTRSPAGQVTAIGAAPQGVAYDARTDTVAVAVRNPARLQLIDPTSLAVRRSVSLPGTVRHLQDGYGGGSVLVPVEPASEIVVVSLPGGSLRATKVGASPHDAAQASDGDLAVGDERGHALTIVRDGRVVHTFDDLTQPGGVIADGTTVGVVDVGAYTLSTYDLTTMRRTARVAAGAGPTHGVLLSGHRFLVVDTRGNRVLEFSADPLKQIGELSVPGSPYGVASDLQNDIVWVTLTALNEVVGLDVSGRTPRVIARYPTVRQPDTVAVAPGSRTLWVTGTSAGVLERISR